VSLRDQPRRFKTAFVERLQIGCKSQAQPIGTHVAVRLRNASTVVLQVI